MHNLLTSQWRKVGERVNIFWISLVIFSIYRELKRENLLLKIQRFQLEMLLIQAFRCWPFVQKKQASV